MALTTEKIVKLRELAERGVDGEKENAKRILTNNGIDWKKPKESIINTIKKSVGSDITKEYSVDLRKTCDMLHVMILVHRFNLKSKSIYMKDQKIIFKATPAEAQKIANIFLNK